MSSFAQTFSTTYPSHHQSSRGWFHAHLSFVNLFSFILLIALCVIYIVQVNHTVSKGYQIRELESEIQELTLHNQTLEVTTQQAQSLENVARATKMIGLVRADRPEYIQTAGPSYALAE
jgi:hypothetical protein